MPVATISLITTPRQARDMLVEVLKDHPELGIGYIGQDDEKRLPQYPAVVVSAGPKEKELHGTHTFAVRLTAFIWVYHAKLSVSHRERSDLDLKLAEDIESVLQEDLTFGNRVIHGWVESQTPGFLQPKASKSDIVVGTRLVWVGLSQERFK